MKMSKAVRNAVIAAPIAGAITLSGFTGAFANELPVDQTAAPVVAVQTADTTQAVAPQVAAATAEQPQGAAATTKVDYTYEYNQGSLDQVSSVFNGINELRASQGLPPLLYDTQISDEAQGWTDYMAGTGNYGHNPDYAEQAPAGWEAAAENVAANWTPGVEGTEGLNQQWAESPGHRENILGDYTHVGIGVSENPNPYYDEATGEARYVTYGGVVFVKYPDGTLLETSYASPEAAAAAEVPVTPEEPVDPPVDPVEPPVEEPVDPVEPPVEEPVDPPVEEPVDPVEPPVEEPVDPVEPPVEEPVEEPVDPPVDPVEPPVEEPVDPVEPPVEEPVEEPVDETPAPGDATDGDNTDGETPVIETPETETPAENEAETPAEETPAPGTETDADGVVVEVETPAEDEAAVDTEAEGDVESAPVAATPVVAAPVETTVVPASVFEAVEAPVVADSTSTVADAVVVDEADAVVVDTADGDVVAAEANTLADTGAGAGLAAGGLLAAVLGFFGLARRRTA